MAESIEKFDIGLFNCSLYNKIQKDDMLYLSNAPLKIYLFIYFFKCHRRVHVASQI